MQGNGKRNGELGVLIIYKKKTVIGIKLQWNHCENCCEKSFETGWKRGENSPWKIKGLDLDKKLWDIHTPCILICSLNVRSEEEC